MLCDNLEGWGVGSGKKAQEGGDVHIPAAESHCCTAETNSIVKQLYSNFKKKKKGNINLIETYLAMPKVELSRCILRGQKKASCFNKTISHRALSHCISQNFPKLSKVKEVCLW